MIYGHYLAIFLINKEKKKARNKALEKKNLLHDDDDHKRAKNTKSIVNS